MIKVKFLEKESTEVAGFNFYPAFKKALNSVLGFEVESVTKQDPEFEGYYLLPIGAASPDSFTPDLINSRTFLLSVTNASIPLYINDFKPAGLTNWALFKNASTSIIGLKEAFREANYTHFGFLYWEYGSVVPFPPDGTYESVSKSILKYLEIYDTYLKRK